MSDFSDYFENAISNTMRGTNLTAFTPYIALFSTLPGEDGTGGTEITTTIRPAGRVACTFGAPSNGVMSNSAIVDFGNAAGGASVVGFAIYDAASGGNMISRKAITTQTVSTGNAVSFAIGALTHTVQ